MKSLAALAILAATSTALPQYEPVIPGSLPFMASMFTVFEDKECPTAAHRWTLSWRKESYAAAHEKGVECQAFNSTWDIWSIRLHYLDEKLSGTWPRILFSLIRQR